MGEIFTNIFSVVEDPRSERNRIYELSMLIGTTFCAVLAGIDSFSGIEDFVEMHKQELSEHFNLTAGIPSHDTYQRLWNAIDPKKFLKGFEDFVQCLKDINSDIISIDGKTIRNSGKENPLHIVSAWCHNNGMVFAQEKVKGKSNEITAIPELLKKLDLRGKTITIDAIGTQRNICSQIVEGGGDYVIALKKNQPKLFEDVESLLKDPENCKLVNENNDKGHGRIEKRIATVCYNISWLQKIYNWPGLACIGKVESIVLKKGKETRETRYYISSKLLTAQELNDVARKHWGIENRLHWFLDCVFNEDGACIRNENSAENIGIIRKWAYAMLVKAKKKPYQSIKSVMRRNSFSISHLIDSLEKIFHA